MVSVQVAGLITLTLASSELSTKIGDVMTVDTLCECAGTANVKPRLEMQPKTSVERLDKSNELGANKFTGCTKKGLFAAMG